MSFRFLDQVFDILDDSVAFEKEEDCPPKSACFQGL